MFGLVKEQCYVENAFRDRKGTKFRVPVRYSLTDKSNYDITFKPYLYYTLARDT